MDCNKDEAVRAKELAESKLEQKDYVGAKKYALKAQNLYPGIDGISQMLIVLEVYLRAENTIRGQVDWFQVLDVHPSADDDAIKKQYKKLSLLLHPDKNTSVGAVGAFQLISDARRLLLKDKQLRVECNQRTQSVPPEPSVQSQKVPAHAGGSSAPAQPSQDTAPAQTGGSSTPSMASRTKPTPEVPMTPKPATFWTICGLCRMQFKYEQIYCRQTLQCQNCYAPFLAKDIGLPKIPRSGPDPIGNVASAQNRGADQTTLDSSLNTNSQQGPGSVNTDPPERVNLKRSRTESHASGSSKRGSKKG